MISFIIVFNSYKRVNMEVNNSRILGIVKLSLDKTKMLEKRSVRLVVVWGGSQLMWTTEELFK